MVKVKIKEGPIIGLDFDGTVVEHAYPEIGDPLPNAIDWILKWQNAGARIILWTMRSESSLAEAVDYLCGYGVELFGVNCNPHQKAWSNSPKAYCHMYVDDAAAFCPLRINKGQERPSVDWDQVGPAVLDFIEQR